PTTGIVHGFQSRNWGNMQYRIASFDATSGRMIFNEGGQQIQRKQGIQANRHGNSPFFVENIFEELDAPGEWFLDQASHTLYLLPPAGCDLSTATIEGTTSAEVIRCLGTGEAAVDDITISGLAFSRTATTYLDDYYNVTRSDWAIQRSAVIYARHAHNVTIDDCAFEHVGGNAIYFDGHNRNHQVRACHFQYVGESAVVAVGRPEALRLYLDWDSQELHGQAWVDQATGMSMEAGPASDDYPADCLIQDCIMHDLGTWGKQVAGVFIATAARIHVDHCTVYDVPRAGICIGDGAWGGHIISHNDIWNTVRETGEHGPFNSWGRERFWRSGFTGDIHDLVMKDSPETVEIHHNRIANLRRTISAGNWTIDLDDGSSNYDIHHNLSLGSTLKLRDGYFRTVHNNIHVSPVGLGWHVWFKDSRDIFERNITVVAGARPSAPDTPTLHLIKNAGMKQHPWGERHDHNLWWNVNTSEPLFSSQGMTWAGWRAAGYGANSVLADPLFVDPLHGDYRVREDSPALALGFENFAMDDFGQRLTRISPFGGTFVGSAIVTLRADQRGGDAAVVRYTVDGSTPTATAPIASGGSITLDASATVCAQTYIGSRPIGFPVRTTFTKVDQLNHPSWLASLLTGHTVLSDGAVASDHHEGAIPRMTWDGLTLEDISGRGDLIDALGGNRSGAYVAMIAADSPWHGVIKAHDLIIAVGDQRISTIADLQAAVQVNKPDMLTVTRNYSEEIVRRR
ncbi:MAG: chitobiase/beta-hexosaminidase C-terminal domain-containing protein, partial [Planctomycetota bacterium]